jgi:NADPH:quinone reductase
LSSGESVLIHGGSGGVGSLAVQLAKLLGAGFVIATANTVEKRAFACSVGADLAIDYSTPDWPAQVLERTGGQGVDVILESVGGDVFEQNFECLAPFGRHVVYGSTRGPGKPFEPWRLMQKAQSLTGFYLPVFFSNRSRVQEAMKFLIDQAAHGKLRTQVATVLPLCQAAEAHRQLEERRVVGAIVLDPRR